MGAKMAVAVAEEMSEERSGLITCRDKSIWAIEEPLSDYRFEKLMKTCLQLQKEKKCLELQVRIELENWRLRAKKGEPSAECRHRISECLKLFKLAQETQDVLIEKEKLRFNLYKNGFGKQAVSKLRARLKFFSILNKQHESLLEMVRKDVQDCRFICRKVNDDSQIRYRLSPKP